NQNAFISENSPFIFSTEKYDSIVVLFDTFRQERKTQILNHIDALSPDEIELLLFQNEARINSFLFFFGRINKDLAPEHEFFSFKHQIDNNIKWAKTLPNNILYKHELDYLLTYDSLTSIHDFLAYVQSQTTNEDLFDYMKVIYIRAIIENPSYWARHQKIFNTEDIEAILEQEKDSKYFSLLKQPTKDYFSTRQGVEAYNFTAERMDGSTLQLSNLEGKLVYIDNWATWCGPCVAQRPLVLEMAKRYKNDPRIEVLMVALNRERKDWVNYLTKNNQLGIKADLFIENGLYSEYANAYNIKSIPKYILISPDGLIINAHVGKPSQELYDLIDQELEKIQLTETSKAISKSSEQSLK
ncbi:MAG: TlpA disulfide reductase family protein, partial [Bacteroidota bacterium]